MSEEIPGYWRNYIGGRWRDAERSLSVENPATTHALAAIALAGPGEVEEAVAAARHCFEVERFGDMPGAERAAMLHRVAVAIRELTDYGGRVACLENGKTLDDGRGEFAEAADYFDYYAGMADKLEGRNIPIGEDYLDFTVHEPYGVSAQVVPWNFPPSIAARSLAPALAAGNTVVIKSPEISPLAVAVLGEACDRAGVPAGAVNILCGEGDEAGAALVSHPGVDQIVFTGSVPTGQSIMHAAADRAVPCVMELGGKSAAVAFEDVDIDQLVASVRNGIFFNAGQVCSAMARLLVHRSRYEEVLDRVTALSEGLTIGPGIDNPDITPLISAGQLDRVEGMCTEALGAGARAVTGGRRVPDTVGHFMQPTVLTDVTPDMNIAREEVFGPVLVVMPFDTDEEAMALANGTDYGLVGGVFTQDIARGLRAARQLAAGQVFVNEWFAGGIQTPFGGTRRSGYGREKGQEALYNYLQTKNVAVRL
ncbi:aldehyde dehydrogenase family protein [Arhodomonas aquaeolei]|uniref:aldehyde dehydrogenase family protein n=1 Tax=Arhodomonas aquaeolei TaxID=2369 RepID=UPI00216AACAB|nr:aldehyde dehydrogenase family protein [Arhodomonas aquaeolei]MCS4505987.1 aldehyde dehydrogenase family protein [Arhodomonas aquaeolei]